MSRKALNDFRTYFGSSTKRLPRSIAMNGVHYLGANLPFAHLLRRHHRHYHHQTINFRFPRSLARTRTPPEFWHATSRAKMQDANTEMRELARLIAEAQIDLVRVRRVQYYFGKTKPKSIAISDSPPYVTSIVSLQQLGAISPHRICATSASSECSASKNADPRHTTFKSTNPT